MKPYGMDIAVPGSHLGPSCVCLGVNGSFPPSPPTEWLGLETLGVTIFAVQGLVCPFLLRCCGVEAAWSIFVDMLVRKREREKGSNEI